MQRAVAVAVAYDTHEVDAKLARGPVDQGFRLEWSASYGASGSISAKEVRITLEPGEPSQS